MDHFEPVAWSTKGPNGGPPVDHIEVVRFYWEPFMVPTMTKMTLAVLALPVVLALSACTATADTNHPAPPPIVAPTTSPPTVAPTPEPTDDSGAFRTGEAVGESSRELWEATKDFGRGVWSGFQGDGDGQ